MKKQILNFLLTLVMVLCISGIASAAEQSNLVGYVDVQQVFQNYPNIKTTMSAVDLEREKAQREFNSKADTLDEKGKEQLSQKLSEQIAKRENDLMGPIQKKIRQAIETVAKREGIGNVVDSAAMIYGGQDLTKAVIVEVNK